MELKIAGIDDPNFGTELTGRKLPPRKSALDAEIDEASIPQAIAGSRHRTIRSLFLLSSGTRLAKGIPLDDVVGLPQRDGALFNQWGYRPSKGESDGEFKERIRAELKRARAFDEAKADDVLVPQVAWGYFPVNASQATNFIV